MRLRHQYDEKTGPERASEGPDDRNDSDKTLGLLFIANISQNPGQFIRDFAPIRVFRLTF